MIAVRQSSAYERCALFGVMGLTNRCFYKHVEARKELGADTILTDWKPPEVK